MTGRDPFSALGLERRGELADDEVRGAWRRVAAATHPDRADGGDPAAFAAAAAAYTLLRTAAGRGEVLADLLSGPGGPRGTAWRLPARIRRGRPVVLALRVLAAAAGSALAVIAIGWQPASPAIITGMLTWLILTGRHDLAAP